MEIVNKFKREKTICTICSKESICLVKRNPRDISKVVAICNLCINQCNEVITEHLKTLTKDS